MESGLGRQTCWFMANSKYTDSYVTCKRATSCYVMSYFGCRIVNWVLATADGWVHAADTTQLVRKTGEILSMLSFQIIHQVREPVVNWVHNMWRVKTMTRLNSCVALASVVGIGLVKVYVKPITYRYLWLLLTCCSSSNAKKWEQDMQVLRNNNARLTSALQESNTNVEEWKVQLAAYKEENSQMKAKVVCYITTLWVKNPPRNFLTFFPKRLGIFSPSFTCLLNLPVYIGLQIFIQLPATLTKLCRIKRDHHNVLKMSTIGRNARWVVALNMA